MHFQSFIKYAILAILLTLGSNISIKTRQYFKIYLLICRTYRVVQELVHILYFSSI